MQGGDATRGLPLLRMSDPTSPEHRLLGQQTPQQSYVKSFQRQVTFSRQPTRYDGTPIKEKTPRNVDLNAAGFRTLRDLKIPELSRMAQNAFDKSLLLTSFYDPVKKLESSISNLRRLEMARLVEKDETRYTEKVFNLFYAAVAITLIVATYFIGNAAHTIHPILSLLMVTPLGIALYIVFSLWVDNKSRLEYEDRGGKLPEKTIVEVLKSLFLGPFMAVRRSWTTTLADIAATKRESISEIQELIQQTLGVFAENHANLEGILRSVKNQTAGMKEADINTIIHELETIQKYIEALPPTIQTLLP